MNQLGARGELIKIEQRAAAEAAAARAHARTLTKENCGTERVKRMQVDV